MCVVGHGYCRLGGGRDRSGGWYACVTKTEWMVACKEMPVHISTAR